jgi:protein phosphatase
VTIKRNLKKALARLINIASQQVFQSASVDICKEGMGTTLVLTVCFGGKLTVAHVGDSRVYLFRNGQLIQLTKDHSKVQELIDRGLILKEHAHKSRLNHILTRAVGVAQEVTVSFEELELRVGDRILLCSDGLTDMVADSAIEDIFLANLSLTVTLKNLIDMANFLGGKDNITVALVEYELPLDG